MALFQTMTVPIVDRWQRPCEDRCCSLKGPWFSQEHGQVMMRVEYFCVTVIPAFMDSNHCFLESNDYLEHERFDGYGLPHILRRNGIPVV